MENRVIESHPFKIVKTESKQQLFSVVPPPNRVLRIGQGSVQRVLLREFQQNPKPVSLDEKSFTRGH
ncbi:MAG: hypothetical protein OXE77_10290 [Flavobacteriaceae bacterium]|nr:hypothetical protein [Flavobacteriaceae bacterium]MCY4266420.1 hypothetical protein [Flavobacteriaceae bacterium]